MVKIIIVDDEPRICKYLRQVINEHFAHAIHVCGVAHSTSQAATLLDDHKPHIALFDIHIPTENAIEFLKKHHDNTKIIFITAYDEYAIQAFKLHALDYLTKPVDETELVNTLQWVIDNYTQESSKIEAAQLRKLDEKSQVVINTHQGRFFINLSELYCIEAHGSYSVFSYCEGQGSKSKHLTSSKPLSYYEDALGANFVRIHKSTIINIKVVTKLDGDRHVVLKDGSIKEASVRKFTDLKNALK